MIGRITGVMAEPDTTGCVDDKHARKLVDIPRGYAHRMPLPQGLDTLDQQRRRSKSQKTHFL